MLTASLFSFAQENGLVLNSRLGVKAGIVNTEISDQKGSGIGTTYFIGGKVDIPFSQAFYLESGLNFIGKGYTIGWSASDPHDRIAYERSYKRDLTFGTDINRIEFGLNYVLGYQLDCGLDVHLAYRQSLTRFRPNIKEMSRAYSIGMGFTF